MSDNKYTRDELEQMMLDAIDPNEEVYKEEQWNEALETEEARRCGYTGPAYNPYEMF